MIRPMGDWLWVLASGLVAIACAVILIANLPEAATWLLGVLLGIHLIAAGGALVLLAWRLRRVTGSGGYRSLTGIGAGIASSASASKPPGPAGQMPMA